MDLHQESKREYKEAFEAVRGILLEHWDPLGLKTEPNALDEYDSYVPQVVSMVFKGTTTADIAVYLDEVEGKRMGLAHVPDTNRSKAAAAVMEWAQNRSKLV